VSKEQKENQVPFEYGTDDWDESVAPKNYAPVPAGIYHFVITGADVGRTKDGNKDTLNLALQIEGDDFDGRYIFDLWVMPDKAIDTDPEKYKQAMGFLKAKLEAIYNVKVTGNFRIDPGDLLGRRGVVQVSVKADPKPVEAGGGFYDPKNVVRRYVEASDPEANTPSPTASAEAASIGTTQAPNGASQTSSFRL
jgi:hypothetical protein